MPGAQAVAGEVDLGISLALAHVVVGALQQLNGCPGAKVAAADADDHEHIGVIANLPGSALDAQDLLGGLPGRQILPAQKIVAAAGTVRQSRVSLRDLLLHCQKIRQGKLAPDMGNVNFNHMCRTRPFY